VKYEGEKEILEALREHRRMRAVDPAGYEPVGVSKCDGCGYENRCWNEAKAARDVALLPAVSQKRARELHARGITSIGQISAAVNDSSHHDYFWTGKKKPIHRDFVSALLKSAEAHETNKAIPTDDPPPLPAATNYAMFDLEGLPPYADDLDRIYLWGVKVFGEKRSSYLPAQSGFGLSGDREGWFAFLEMAAGLFATYGPDLPFIHWSSYEKTKITDYINRYGDLPLPLPAGPDQRGRPAAVGNVAQSAAFSGRGEGRPGIAAQVLSNLTDLYALTKASYALPLPSYSLKVVEKFVEYRRTLADANGAWSIAEYIKATETNDPVARAAIVNQILAYNEEDLDATWAVLQWLEKKR